MEPLSGNAEQISARTAAVMVMKIIVTTKEDLCRFLNTPIKHISIDKPYRCWSSSKKSEEQERSIETISAMTEVTDAVHYLTPPIKFRATKLAAKLSISFQLRCNS